MGKIKKYFGVTTYRCSIIDNDVIQTARDPKTQKFATVKAARDYMIRYMDTDDSDYEVCSIENSKVVRHG